jgi:hypothetical protein
MAKKATDLKKYSSALEENITGKKDAIGYA